jgi:23S rRNA (cytidine1920-2'-O)/16S rRNA (cytidine1409-2'-O)-methyltransferase
VKVRADVLLQKRGLAESRAKAQALILAGSVVAGDHRVDKPGQLLEETVELRVKEQLRYVSRGGLKLASALDAFGLSPERRVCLDLGASTGGFTDVLLQRGAERVHAVDVGYGQLHPRLRGDPRVVVHERVNARDLRLDEACSVAVADLSFISLRLVLPALVLALRPADAWTCVLVKPQFEAGRAEVGKGGVVRDRVARPGAGRQPRIPCRGAPSMTWTVGWRDRGTSGKIAIDVSFFPSPGARWCTSRAFASQPLRRRPDAFACACRAAAFQPAWTTECRAPNCSSW